MFSCYCKSCRTLIGTHLKMEEGHYCNHCPGIESDPVDQLAKTEIAAAHDRIKKYYA